MYAAALRASGDTVAALWILAASIFSNLLLDLLFVAYFHDGIAGVAKATALTLFFAAFLCIAYLFHSHRKFLFQKKDCILRLSMIYTTLKCSLITSLHQASLYIGKALVQGTVNTGGTELISAYTAGTSQAIAFSRAVHYLRFIAWFYPLCFIGGTFTGHFNGISKMIFTLCGTLLQIVLRVILSASFFPGMQLNAVALATGLGWFLAVSFWSICYLMRHQR